MKHRTMWFDLARHDENGATPPEPTLDTTLPESKPDTEPLGENGKATLAAERKARREAEKAAADAQAKVKEYEDAQRSDAERLELRAKEAEARAAEAERELLRRDIASAKGLPTDALELLTGSNREELEAAADKLAALIAARPQPPKGPPVDGSEGPQPTPPTDMRESPEEFAAEMRKFGLRARSRT